MITILEDLQYVRYNLTQNLPTIIKRGLLPLVIDQLNMLIILLEKGYGVNESRELLLDKYDSIDKVPDKTITNPNGNVTMKKKSNNLLQTI